MLAEITGQAEGLARTSELLADDRSRELLLDVLCVRVLGDHHVRLPVSQSDVRDAAAELDATAREAEAVEQTRGHGPLHRYRVQGAGGDVRLIGRAFMVHEFFGERQYALDRDGVAIAARPGDTVVDGGGGWGETALYFADAVGPEGRVVSFEFVADNLRVLNASLELNPRLADRIQVVPHPVWHSHGQTLRFDDAGGQTMVGDQGQSQARSETIDHVCRGAAVDFIKLDVEGAEMAALRGAEQTIRAHRPALAVSVYHSVSDMVDVPAWIDGLDLGYRLYLEHRWPGPAETILFARPD